MCEAAAYVAKEDREELILEAVDLIEPEPDGTFRLVSIFGEQRIVKGRIKIINLVNHRVVFEE
ncbi:MAG: CooT family nickel-binding protein [Thermodesulfobacteriota bacterium]